jgi:hypothetical protein
MVGKNQSHTQLWVDNVSSPPLMKQLAFFYLALLCWANLPLQEAEEGNGFMRQQTFRRQTQQMVKEKGKHFEFVHIAKTAGRSMKIANERMEPSSRPFEKSHGHNVKVSHVLERNHTAVVVLRDPADRMESAFVFLRTGGFGNRIPKEHLITEFNSTDAFVEALAGESILAIEAARCDAKLKFCAEAPASGEKFSLYKHTTVEFRPQVWWLDVDENPNVRIICYPDLHDVFPNLKRPMTKETVLSRSLKGHWYVKRYLSQKNREKITRLYPEDTLLYNVNCK